MSINNKKRIWVCVDGPHCCKRKPGEVLDALKQAAADQKADDKFEVLSGGCLGMCHYGPNCIVMNGRTRYGYSRLKSKDAAEIITAHNGQDVPVERLRINRSKK